MSTPTADLHESAATTEADETAARQLQRRLTIACVCSGYAALTYEMSWVRQLVMSLGVTYFAITTILAVFMGGLALGALVAGRLVDRWRGSPLVVFAGIEVFLAVYALAFPALREVADGAYLALAVGDDVSFLRHALLRAAFAAVILLPPTLASGATLPVLARSMIREDPKMGGTLARLYSANVIGAALGCSLTTFVVIGKWGFPAAAWSGALANLSAAALALSLPRVVAHALPQAAEPLWRRGAGPVVVTYFAVGAAAIGGEVLWTRVMAQSGFNPATYVFGFVLVTFLLGHGLGAGLLFRQLTRRVAPERVYPWLPALSAVSLLAAILMLPLRQEALTPIGWLRELGVVLPWQRALLLIPGVFLPAMLSGVMFPLASVLTIRSVSTVGSGVGSLSATSTLGGIFGSLCVGFWLMPTFGTIPCLLGAAALYALAGVGAAVSTAGWTPARAAAVAGVAVAGAVALSLSMSPASHLILFPSETLVAFDEGRNSSTAMVTTSAGRRILLVSGERLLGGGSDVPFALEKLHPTGKDVAVIGVGTGTVASDALLSSQVRSVTAIDIDGDIPQFIPMMLPERHHLFTPPRFQFVENDGRHFLTTTDRRFDLIVNDAAIYAWYLELSTLEFNRLARSRLAPEGLYVGRLHIWRITREALVSEIRTFTEVFPNSAFYMLTPDIGMLVGRNGDAPVDEANTERRGNGPRLWYTTEQLHEMGKEGRLITDDHPLHVADTFEVRDLYPIIEFTSFDVLDAQAGNAVVVGPQDAPVDEAGEVARPLNGERQGSQPQPGGINPAPGGVSPAAHQPAQPGSGHGGGPPGGHDPSRNRPTEAPR